MNHSTSSQNGSHKDYTLADSGQNRMCGMTSPESGEVIPILQQSSAVAPAVAPPSVKNRTIFPKHTLTASTRLWLYLLPKRLWFGASLLRWIYILLIFGTMFYFLARFPLRWAAVVFGSALFVALLYGMWKGKQNDFVNFVEEPYAREQMNEYAPLGSHEKIAIHATGRFEVANKAERFTWLPGFYRTFATHEHAVMCLVEPGQFDRVAFWARIGYWAPDTEGMWYMFLTADLVDQIRMGFLDFGHTPQPSVAIDYTLTLPPRNRLAKLFKGKQIITETLYLACESQEDCARIFADLQVDLQQI